MSQPRSGVVAGSLFFLAALLYFLPGPLIRGALSPELAVATSLSRASGAVRSPSSSRLILIGDDPWGTPYYSEEREGSGGSAGAYGARWGKTTGVGSSARSAPMTAFALPIYDQRSLGPDGVDQGGQGDDVVIDSVFVREQGVGEWGQAGKLAVAWDGAWLLAIVLAWVGYHCFSEQRGARREAIYLAIQSIWPVIVVGVWTWSSLRPGSTWPLRGVLRLLADQSLSQWSVLFGSYPLFFCTGLAARLFVAPRPEPALDELEPSPAPPEVQPPLE